MFVQSLSSSASSSRNKDIFIAFHCQMHFINSPVTGWKYWSKSPKFSWGDAYILITYSFYLTMLRYREPIASPCSGTYKPSFITKTNIIRENQMESENRLNQTSNLINLLVLVEVMIFKTWPAESCFITPSPGRNKEFGQPSNPCDRQRALKGLLCFYLFI